MIPRRRLGLAAAGIAAGLALAVIPAVAASAHPSQTSAVLVTVNADSVDLALQIPLDRYTLATDSDLEVTEESVASHEDEIISYVLDHLHVTDENGTLDQTVESVTLGTVNDAPALLVDVVASPVDATLDGNLTLDYSVVSERIATHDVYVSLVSDYSAGALTDEEPQLLAVLTTDDTTVALERPVTSWWQGFAATIQLGMSHIAGGTDHLLFLGMLLLAGTTVRSRSSRSGFAGRLVPMLTRTALIATAFTLGHSLTLVLVTLGWLSVPTVVVESLVAVSIVVAAVHAARPVLPRLELVIAALFGLVHGAAFAKTLVELDLEPGALAGALVGFNLGVEAAQLIAIALILPPLALASSSRWFVGVRYGLAIVGGLAGVAWLVGVLTGTDSVFQGLFDAVAAYPVLAYGLYASALVAVAWSCPRMAASARRAPDRGLPSTGHRIDHGVDDTAVTERPEVPHYRDLNVLSPREVAPARNMGVVVAIDRDDPSVDLKVGREKSNGLGAGAQGTNGPRGYISGQA